MPLPAVTPEQYQAALAGFRERPGNFTHAGKAAGIRQETAKRLWEGPPAKGSKWAVPIKDVLAAEEKEAEEQRIEAEVAARVAAAAAREKYKSQEAEAEKADQNILRACRSSVLNGLVIQARIAPGLNALAVRVNTMLERGTDAQGNVLDIDPVKALSLMRQFSLNSKALMDAANTLILLDEHRSELPSAVLAAAEGGDVTFAEAEEMNALGNKAAAKVRELQLIRGGKLAAPKPRLFGLDEGGDGGTPGQPPVDTAPGNLPTEAPEPGEETDEASGE